MLARLPAALRAVGLVVLTGWVAAYLGVIATGAKVGDITFALVIGLLLVGVGVLLEVRAIQVRVPFLRPAGHELSRVLREADRLRAVVAAASVDVAQIEEWRRQTLEWGEDARRTVARYLPDREHWFVRNLLTDIGTDGANWYDISFRSYIDPRIARLEELLREQR